ncbi:MAG: ornithine carbamoyltransferase [Deltaproteobacteria bacterium]|nr:ornithine carbamoyltransferase [Deltaproteobacteria bacterium]
MNKRDVLTLRDLGRADLGGVLSLAAALKRERGQGRLRPLLAGKKLALVFQKPSLRTRATFDIGMTELGGSTLFLGPDEIHLGERETPADCVRVLDRLVDILAVRTFAQEIVEEMAHNGSVPVINALSDLYHPCQVLADLLTLQECKGRIEGLKVVFVGDGNNVAHSWLLAAEKLPFRFVLACPEGFEPDGGILDSAVSGGADVAVTHDPAEAVSGADAIYTDVWASMGQEAEAGDRRRSFAPFQVNGELVSRAKDDVAVMHCLPAHRGEEITGEVIEGRHSVVFDQAENRLHAQKALMVWCLGVAA